jgi:alkylhydroperoxidase/carboxymuconolactone decarboxylase family protein YurZ
MPVNPLDIYRQFDLKVPESFENVQDLMLSEGSVSQKPKLLIAMAIDVEHGAQQGATAPCQRVMKLGATNDEIIEVNRVAYYEGGNRVLFTGALMLQNLFK